MFPFRYELIIRVSVGKEIYDQRNLYIEKIIRLIRKFFFFYFRKELILS